MTMKILKENQKKCIALHVYLRKQIRNQIHKFTNQYKLKVYQKKYISFTKKQKVGDG